MNQFQNQKNNQKKNRHPNSLSNQDIDKVLKEYEQTIQRSLNKIHNEHIKDEIAQEMRINIWKIGLGCNSIEEYRAKIDEHIGVIYRNAVRSVYGSKNKDYRRRKDLKQKYETGKYKIKTIDDLSYFVNYLHFNQVWQRIWQELDERYKIIIKVILASGNLKPNFDFLSRLLGYQGKGGGKAAFNRMVKEIHRIVEKHFPDGIF